MITTHNLGYPRIGPNRELKFALERFWRAETDVTELEQCAADLRQANWQSQKALALVPVGDFSLYDQVLDMSFTLGNVPDRVDASADSLDQYFQVARGRSGLHSCSHATHAGEMTKWFDTNYHYIVPEFYAGQTFALDSSRLIQQINEARAAGVPFKPVIIGPLTYLWLGKAKDGSNPLDLLEQLLPVYVQLLGELQQAGAEWVQIDEPILVTELDSHWRNGFERAYHALSVSKINKLLTTYFGPLKENLRLACDLPVQGLHIDAVRARDEIKAVVDWLPSHKVLSLGVIEGRNIWKADLAGVLDWLEPVYEKLQSRLWLAPACSLLHVPVDLDSEETLDKDVHQWLAFARQKLDEITLLAVALEHGRHSVADKLADNSAAIAARKASNRVHNPQVQRALEAVTPQMANRNSAYPSRAKLQHSLLQLPLYPTTTIGSFPQTQSIRATRQQYKRGQMAAEDYRAAMQQEVAYAVAQQEKLGLDVLVHGEPERNDMVEYFGEQLEGYVFSGKGWVQSYGSRCVKPPILFGDISRPQAMTVEWASYAQSLTDKPMKGMLTGPVTILNWSFVRDDQPRAQTCRQLALAIREEVQDLEAAGIKIIQIDEAALREGLPLRKSQWQAYLDWSVEAFRIAANGVADETQIHTHMCYSEFNDIIEDIAKMDADVITIETSRSDMELLEAFKSFQYPNQIGPGVYDIHSPNIPATEQMVKLMGKAVQYIPAERLWVNPDCGLKTRGWAEVVPALENMVAAARQLREQAAHKPHQTETEPVV